MNIARRKFMKTGMMVAACAGIPLKAQLASAQKTGEKSLKKPSAIKAPQASPNTRGDMLGFYNKSTFTPHVNTQFRVRIEKTKVRKVTLVEVKDYLDASGEESTGEERFSLFFSSHGITFPPNTYEVEHAALGKFRLFITPIGMRSGGEQYFEAAFNRLNK